MLSAKLQLVAQKVSGKFDKAGTELITILRDVRATNEYGGTGVTSTTESEEIPGVLTYLKSARLVQTAAGQEYTDAEVLLPAVYSGENVDVQEKDRLKVLAREGNNPERVFQVKRIDRGYGVYFKIDVVTAT